MREENHIQSSEQSNVLAQRNYLLELGAELQFREGIKGALQIPEAPQAIKMSLNQLLQVAESRQESAHKVTSLYSNHLENDYAKLLSELRESIRK